MRQKIFISYRRQDSAANALGIGQYLEHEFGRKNVFIDVDMRAGAKFPSVLEERLAECKVMVVLIGPDWLDARDELGSRRLDDPSDWVRLEISHALRRNITVIPVRVNGAGLPSRTSLPEDIRGLVDHQAASVTIASFRNEMAGLVRDIRAVPDSGSWRRFGAIAAGVAAVAAIVLGAHALGGFFNSIERVRNFVMSSTLNSMKGDQIWKWLPGEMVLYGYTTVGKFNLAHLLKPSSLRVLGDRVAYQARYALEPPGPAETDKAILPGVYEEVINVIDCKTRVAAMAERVTYNIAGEIVARFKWGEPETLDLNMGGPIKTGTILATGAAIMCDSQMRSPIIPKLKSAVGEMTYLRRTLGGDGSIYYGEKKTTQNSQYPIEIIAMIKYDVNHQFSEAYPGTPIMGLPPSFQSRADRFQFDCVNRNTINIKYEYYDSENNLVSVSPILTAEPVQITQGSPLEVLLGIVCGPVVPNVRGTYEGTNQSKFVKGGQGDEKIVIVVEQAGASINVTFQSATGGQGKGSGTLSGAELEAMPLRSTLLECPGSYEASLKFADDTVSWSFKGQDCGGPMEGKGTAKRTKM